MRNSIQAGQISRSGYPPVPLQAESLASVLVNAKTTGDAGNRSDHFLGSSLDPKWSNNLLAASSVSNSVFAFNSTLNNSSSIGESFTPSGAFRLEARVGCTAQPIYSTTTGQGPAMSVADLTGANNVSVEFNNSWLMSKFVGSVYTGVAELTGGYGLDTWQNSIGPGISFGMAWAYIALTYDGAGNWVSYGSWDRNFWQQIGTVSLTFTPNNISLQGYSNNGVFFVDFVDVVS